jgi:hypothetical protein
LGYNIAYKLPVQKWQLRSEDEKAIVKQRKLEIQELRTIMGLPVDVPKPGCNTNNGNKNKNRRFFTDPELAGAITGIDVNLIYRFKVILQAISCGQN